MATTASIALRRDAAHQRLEASMKEIALALGIEAPDVPKRAVRKINGDLLRVHQLEAFADFSDRVLAALEVNFVPAAVGDDTLELDYTPDDADLNEDGEYVLPTVTVDGQPVEGEVEEIDGEPGEGEQVEDFLPDDEQESESTDLEAMTVAELRELADERGIELRSNMKKAEIIEALES